MAQEKVVTTRFIDGIPDGVRVCTSPLSPITTVYMPRNLLARAKQLNLPKRGIYYLVKSGSTDIKKLYVGQTVKGIQRLNDHNQKKKKWWWDVAVLFLSNDAHTFTLDVVTGLEKHAIEQAIHVLGGIVENKIDPKYVIQAHDKPTVDSLYSEIEFMMKSLGYRLDGANSQGQSIGASIGKQPKSGTPIIQGGTAVTMTRRGLTVAGMYSGGKDGTLTLLKGAVIDLAAKMHPKDKGNSALRMQLLAQGDFTAQNGGQGTLMKDVTFKSPTAAAQFVFGGSINGRLYWKDLNGQSIKAVWG